MRRKNAIFLSLAVIALVTLGLIMLTSTSVWSDKVDGYSLVKKQAVWILIGVIGAGLLASFDYRKLIPYWKPLLAGACFLLILCYIPGIKQEIKGEHRWIKIPGIPQFQPSEIAKIIVIIALAAWYAHFQTENKTFFKGFICPGVLLGVPTVLIFFEKDMGTAAGLGAAGLMLMFVAGARMLYLGGASLITLACAGIAIWLNPERMGRINALFDLEGEKYRLGDGYQQLHGLYAFANGGINGMGLGNGVEKMGYLPEAHTDFIFPSIGEELGLFYTLGAIFCFLMIVILGIAIALNAKDIFGRLTAIGLTGIIVVPAMMNIGVCTAVLPNTGLPLPFISYGGTNLIFTLLAVGLLISIHRQSIFQDHDKTPLLSDKKFSVRI